MNFRKIFNIGYAIYVAALMIVYFLLPAEKIFIAIMILTIPFGVFNIVLASKFHHTKK